jgi:DNA-binding beta-propeller fold protein YncE
MIVLGVIFVGGIVAAALDLRFVIGGAPRRVEPNSILALDPRTMASVSDRKGGFAAPSPVRAAGLVWTVDGDRNLVIATNPFSKRVFRQEVVGTDPVAVAVGYGAAWVANAGNGSITRVPLVGSKIETLGLDDQPSAIATGAGYVWVVSRRSGKVIRIDPKTKQVDKSVRLANPPLAVAVRPPGRVELEIGD